MSSKKYPDWVERAVDQLHDTFHIGNWDHSPDGTEWLPVRREVLLEIISNAFNTSVLPALASSWVTPLKVIKFVVNGREKTATEGFGPVHYATIVALANTRLLSGHAVTYYHQSGKQGILHPGESVELLEGMVFNAIVTSGA